LGEGGQAAGKKEKRESRKDGNTEITEMRKQGAQKEEKRKNEEIGESNEVGPRRRGPPHPLRSELQIIWIKVRWRRRNGIRGGRRCSAGRGGRRR